MPEAVTPLAVISYLVEGFPSGEKVVMPMLDRPEPGDPLGALDITLPDKNLVAPIVPWEFGAPVNEQLAWANYEVLKPEERTRSNKD